MRRLDQETYSEPEAAETLSEEPLVLHHHPGDADNATLIVFVHGLGGKRYGKRTTWGQFPRLLFDDFPTADIGMYQYRSAADRLFSSKSVRLQAEADVFADLVRDELSGYRTIVLIGHSMGGLLCKAMIRRLVGNREQNSLDRIGGLILMATPQLGSLRMPRFLSMFSADAQALEAHGDFVTEINRTFEDHIALDENALTLRKTTIPTWAVEGVHDRWVDPLSSGIGLPSSRRKLVRGSHTSIVKPRDGTADTYAWVKKRIEICLHRFTYDVFLAAAMAAHPSDAAYAASRATVTSLIDVLQTKCGFESVFYAGRNMASMRDFDPEALALDLDLKAMRESRYFVLYYPEKVASSVLYEAGWALVLGKPSIYLVRDTDDLPFLLNDAGQAFDDGRVRIFEGADSAAMLREVASYGEKLFRYAAG